jgi:1,4-alpha-glucan branching enzyme
MNRFLSYLLSLSFFAFACGKGRVDNDGDESGIPTYRDGVTRIDDDSLAFVLFAPKKSSVHLIGDFNDWEVSDAYKMRKNGDRFWIKIGGLDKNKEYLCQYLIDDQIRIADPYANKIVDPVNDPYIPTTIYPNPIPYPSGKTTEIAAVVSTKQKNYDWKTNNSRVDKNNLLVYEILIRDFTEMRSIKGVQAKLPYLKELGVNAVELMPFNEFEGNDGWGYNPSFYFATDKAYGAGDDYKAFIDACHENGMAVIMDIALNHSYGQSPLVRMYQSADGKPSADNPWYNVSSPNTLYSWGYDFNHESQHTKAFVDSVCAYWMKEYRIDGYRFDFTKGFTNKAGDGRAYDQSRIDILKRMVDEIRKRNQDAIVIFEHLADNDEEKILADYGVLLWGNLNYNMNEATMGWGEENDNGSTKGDISWGSYKQRGWAEPNLLAYMESHDEERLMYKNEQWGKEHKGYDVKQIPVGLQRTAAAAVMLISLPGPKMLWQFGELGYDYKLGASMEDGRLDKKPIPRDYYDAADRKALHDVFAKMIALHKNDPVFSSSDYTADLTNNFKYIVLKSTEKTVAAMANFDVIPQSKNVDFGKTGIWKDYFGESEIASDTRVQNISLAAGEYRLYFSQ